MAYGKTRTNARHVLTIASACPDVYARFPACSCRSANGRSPADAVRKHGEFLRLAEQSEIIRDFFLLLNALNARKSERNGSA